MTENPYRPPEADIGLVPASKGFFELAILDFLRHWNGHAKLATAFWGHFVIGNIVFFR